MGDELKQVVCSCF